MINILVIIIIIVTTTIILVNVINIAMNIIIIMIMIIRGWNRREHLSSDFLQRNPIIALCRCGQTNTRGQNTKHNTYQNTKHNTNISKKQNILNPSSLSAGVVMDKPTQTGKTQNISFFNDCNTFTLQNKEPIYLQGDRNKIWCCLKLNRTGQGGNWIYKRRTIPQFLFEVHLCQSKNNIWFDLPICEVSTAVSTRLCFK